MTRKLSQAQDGAARMLSIRLPPALHEALEREAARRSQAAGGIPVSTAAIVRAMIERNLGVDQARAEQVPAPPAAVSHPATPVAARSARVMRPSTPGANSSPSSSPRGDAPPEAVEALRAALRAAVDRGVSVNAIAVAARMPGGGTRRRIAALLAGESPPVTAALARAVTAAAEQACPSPRESARVGCGIE